mgnify:CR=1
MDWCYASEGLKAHLHGMESDKTPHFDLALAMRNLEVVKKGKSMRIVVDLGVLCFI